MSDQYAPLFAVATVNNDVLPETTDSAFSFDYVDISSISDFHISGSLAQFTFREAPSRARRLAKPGDVALSTVRTYLRAIAPITEQHSDSVFSTGFAIIRPNPSVCDSMFLRYATLSTDFIDSVVSHSNGVSYPAINAADVIRLRIPLPPLETQRRIADYLDRETAEIDAAVADLDRYVELLEKRVESAGREIFNELSNKHPLIQTKFLVDITTGSGDTQDAVGSGEFPFYVRSDTVQRSTDYEFEGDAVLTSGDGAGVGKIFHLASGKFKAHQRVYVMHNFRRVSPSYFYWMFKSAFPDVIKYGGAKSTVDSVRMPMIANLKLPVPAPAIQETVSRRFTQLDQEASALIKDSTKVRDLLLKRRSVLITEVVTGRKQV